MARRSAFGGALAAAAAAVSYPARVAAHLGRRRLYFLCAHRGSSLAAVASPPDARLRPRRAPGWKRPPRTGPSGVATPSTPGSPLPALQLARRGFATTVVASALRRRIPTKISARLRKNLVYRAWQKPIPSEMRTMLDQENEPGKSVLLNYKLVSKFSVVKPPPYFESFSKIKYRQCELSDNPVAQGVPVVVKVKGKEAHKARRGVFVMMATKEDPVKDEKRETIAKARLEAMGLTQEVYAAARYAILLNRNRNKIVSGADKKELAESVTSTESVVMKPTPVQALGIPAILGDNRHIVLAAETGTGKTLAYLVPIIQKLKAEEEAAKKAVSDPPAAVGLRTGGPVAASPLGASATVANVLAALRPPPVLRRPKRPRAIIVVPTRELVLQVLETAKDMSRVVDFTVHGIVSDTSPKTVRQIMSKPVDILITTVSGALKLHKKNEMSFASTRFLVIDEADSHLEEGWIGDVRRIITQVKESAANQGGRYQLIMVSATLPRGIRDVLREELPDALELTTPALHCTRASLRQTFIDVKNEFAGNKEEAILRVLREASMRGDRRLMIFCNTKRCACYLYVFLQHRQASPLLFHSHMSDERREATLKYFKSDNYDPFVPPQDPAWLRARAAAKAAEAEDDEQRGEEAYDDYEEKEDDDDGDVEEKEEEEENWLVKEDKKGTKRRNAERLARMSKLRAAARERAAKEWPEHGPAEARKIRSQFAKGTLQVPFSMLPDTSSEVPSSQRMKVMVCSDLAARGVDIPAVDHVVLFDFPKTMADYLHRVGRTARAGKVGRATSLVGRKERQLAVDVQKAIRVRKALALA